MASRNKGDRRIFRRRREKCVCPQRGGALLAVLWLTAALSAIAFSLAASVRGEAERTASAVESLRAYYLATGAIDRALLYLEWGGGYERPDGAPPLTFTAGRTVFRFPTGDVELELIPEPSKINLNRATPEQLYLLFEAVGLDADRARDAALEIEAWRSGGAPEQSSEQGPSFPARHASFQEIEELLAVRGITPEMFYGTYQRDDKGRLVRRSGLRDCLTVYGSGAGYDANVTEPAVLTAIGVPPDITAAIVAARRVQPFTDIGQVQAITGGAPGTEVLTVGAGATAFTLRATARLRLQNGALAEERRSVAAVVKHHTKPNLPPYQIVRWYDDVWTQ